MKRARGSSRFELLVAATLIAVFAAVLLDRLAFYQEAAEKAKVEYSISVLKSALRIQMATMLAEGRTGNLALLAQQNPLDWLEEKPTGSEYVSVAAGSALARKAAGQWQFDAQSRTLTYWPLRDKHLQADASGCKCIRLQVRTITIMPTSNPDTAIESPKATIASIRLHVEPYQWFQAR